MRSYKMKGDFLDFTKEHKLSETECELITMFRCLNNTQQQVVFKILFDVISEKYNEKCDK